ncbi:MAG: methylenetetrahydrofolate reductase [Spirochaetia bacterium]|nr:methylenetetrahydrofolate reductase [Spirochaetia bacterium]
MESHNDEYRNTIKFDIHQNSVKSVLEILDSKAFSCSAEIIPPRNGTDFFEVFTHISKLEEAKFDFLSVTHGAGGSLRGGTLPIAYHSQNAYGLTSIAHLTCRGVSAEDMENMLIDHHYFGIHNILALRGDPPDGLNAGFQAAPGGFSYAHELVRLIKCVNNGKYLKRSGFDDSTQEYRKGMKTRFCIGVACYPEDKDNKGIEYLQVKKNTGADFAITQMIFDYDVFARFIEETEKLWGNQFHVIPGIRIPVSLKQLTRMREKFGINIPDNLYKKMENVSNSEEAMLKCGEDWARNFIAKIQKLGVKGIHFFIMGHPDSAIAVKQDN